MPLDPPTPLAVLPRAARALALAAALGAAAGCGQPPARPAPSVLLVVLDSLAAGHVEPYGATRATSPTLRALAAEGVTYERVWAPTAWTVPSVAGLFTGLEQERHGLRHLGQRLGEAHATLAERFAAGGWRTSAVIQNPLLAGATGLSRGFGRYDVLGWENEDAERAVALALEEWRRAGEGPLFLYLHLAPPHMPYRPPEAHRGRFAPAVETEVDGSILSCRRIHKAGLAADDPRVLRLAALYDEHVRFADALVGRLRAGLGDGPWILAVTSDHGEAFMEHGSQGHSATVYEEMVRVPLVIAGAGLPAGVRVRAPVALIDLGPTLLELCALPAELGSGRSQARAWSAAADGGERAIFVSGRYRADPGSAAYGLVVGSDKLVVQGGAIELFDLKRDPRETWNLAFERPARAAELAEEATRFWRERVPAAAESEPADLREYERALHALGYLQEEAEGVDQPPETRR